MNLRSTVASAAIVIALGATATATAEAAPIEGSLRPAISLVDAWDRPLTISPTGSKPILVIYEDKDSAPQNLQLKRELSELAKGGAYRTAVTLLPIADVAGYNYFPARNFAKEAIRSESRTFDTPIYCDWDASVRRTLGLRGGVSNVVFYGRDGKVLFSREGTLTKEQRTALLDLIRAQLNPKV